MPLRWIRIPRAYFRSKAAPLRTTCLDTKTERLSASWRHKISRLQSNTRPKTPSSQELTSSDTTRTSRWPRFSCKARRRFCASVPLQTSLLLVTALPSSSSTSKVAITARLRRPLKLIVIRNRSQFMIQISVYAPKSLPAIQPRTSPTFCSQRSKTSHHRHMTTMC